MALRKVSAKSSRKVVKVGIQGPPGSGADTVSTLFSSDFVCGVQPLSALRVVALEGGKLVYASSGVLSHAYTIVGLLLSAIVPDASIRPLRQGVVSDASWNWMTDRPIFLGLAGTLTQVPPGTGILVRLGTPLSPQQINFEIQETILL